jgi:hypothetical protein
MIPEFHKPYGKMELILTIITKLGSGGYILGFTEDRERAKLLKDYKLEGIPVLIHLQ